MHSSARREPVLTVQVDVDTTKNLSAFYGFSTPAEYEDNVTYRLALPRFAELFKSLDICATFFVIGQDLNCKANQEVIRQLSAGGHEIANHTQTHPYDFVHLSRQQKRQEIAQAEQSIKNVIGSKPVGFRAPGYDADPDVLHSLVDLGYLYDSSVLPSILNLPFKLIQRLMKEHGTPSGYGSLSLSLAPNSAYRPNLQALWRTSSTSSLWEIPVSCVPYLRLPFYANFNLLTGNALFRLSSSLAAKHHCNYVFHAVEMLDPSEIDVRLHRHPNARLSLDQKIARCRSFLQELMKRRRVMSSQAFAIELEEGRN